MRQVIGSKDPSYQRAQLGDGKAEERMRGLYQGFVISPANRAALGAAIRDVANAAGPVLFHCSAGKDRTGVLTDTILRAVGVPATTAESDYLRDQAVHDYGSFGGFLTSGLGLDADTLLRLRARLVR